MKYHTLFFFRNLGKMLQNLSSAADVIGALRVKSGTARQCRPAGVHYNHSDFVCPLVVAENAHDS